MKKKIIITVVVLALLMGGTVGIAFGVRAWQKSRLVADVTSVSWLNWGYYEDSMESEGMVNSDAVQSVYVDTAQIIREVYVTEGQEVKAGDPLLAYDVTSLELSLEMKKLELQSLENQSVIAQRELARLKKIRPTENQTQPETSDRPALPQQVTDGAYNYLSSLSEASNYGEADGGTAENPYHFECNPGAFLLGDFLNEAVMENAVCDIGTKEELLWTIHGETLKTWYDPDSRWSVETREEVIPEIEGPSVDVPQEPSYTAEELARAIREKEQQIKKLDLDKRRGQLFLSQMEKQLEDGVVHAELNGQVKTVGDPQNLPVDGTPFLVVTSSEGLYVKGCVSELMLDQIQEGQPITAMSWETGMMYTGYITGVEPYPEEQPFYYGGGNSNVSYYPYTALIEEPEGLVNGQYITLTIGEIDFGGEEGIFLEKAYVREEDGKSYVMKDENGKLVKQYVVTGKKVPGGGAVQILSGLTEDDYLAFPYGKTAQEGVATQKEQY